jgi:hypothetical protein
LSMQTVMPAPSCPEPFFSPYSPSKRTAVCKTELSRDCYRSFNWPPELSLRFRSTFLRARNGPGLGPS